MSIRKTTARRRPVRRTAPRVPHQAHEAALELMSSVDRAWLAMDQRDNPMIVSSIMELRGVRSVKRLAQTIAERLSQHVRFRQCADDARSPAVWITQDKLDLAYHLRILRPSGVNTAQGLRDAIAREMEIDLNHAFPLWRLTFYVGAGGQVTLLFRAHHAVADGIALTRLLLRVMDPPEASAPTAAPVEHAAHGGPLGPLIDRLEVANDALTSLRQATRDSLDHPREALGQLGVALAGAAAVGRVLTRRDNNPECFRRPLSGKRIVDWSDALPLEPLREFAHRSGVKLNDLFLAALAGAFGHYLREHGRVSEKQNLRISIPVNLRSVEDNGLGNHFGLVLLDLPVGVEDDERRRSLVAQRMNRLKKSAEARAVLASLAAVGHLPVFAEKRLVNLVAGKACAVVSNLPGPDHVLHLAGAKLSRAIFWPPQTGSIGVGVSILSYAGAVTMAMCCDAGVLPDPSKVVRYFQIELEALVAEGSGRARPQAARTAE